MTCWNPWSLSHERFEYCKTFDNGHGADRTTQHTQKRNSCHMWFSSIFFYIQHNILQIAFSPQRLWHAKKIAKEHRRYGVITLNQATCCPGIFFRCIVFRKNKLFRIEFVISSLLLPKRDTVTLQ